MTDTTTSREWRGPQLVRDRKPHRPGFPENVVKLGRDAALALLGAKLHSELYEIQTEPDAAEEYADFLTVLQSVFEVVSPEWEKEGATWVADPRRMPLPAFATALDGASGPSGAIERELLWGLIHSEIERFGRNLLDWSVFTGLVHNLARAAATNGIDPLEVADAYIDKAKRLGGFDGHVLWHSTEF